MPSLWVHRTLRRVILLNQALSLNFKQLISKKK